MNLSFHPPGVTALLVLLLSACASAPRTGPSRTATTAATAATAAITAASAAPATAPSTAAVNAADLKRQATFDQSQDSWTGARVRELVAKLGPPTSQVKQPDGSLVYVYAKSAKSGITTTFSCVVRYLVDARNDRVTGHQIDGC